MALRKNIRNLRPDELAKFREAHRLIMSRVDNRGYQYIAGRHGWPDGDCKHEFEYDEMGRRHDLFLPWHRAYMYHVERYLQIATGDNSLGLCWWHPRSQESEGLPKAYSERTYTDKDGTTQPNPLYSFRMNFRGRDRRTGGEINVNRDTEREVGRPPLTIAWIRQVAEDATADIPQLFRINDFAQFSERLRNWWHNYIHGYVGGDMGEPNLAAYDPIFYPHHSNMDRIWAIWQNDHGVDNVPSYMKDVVLRPFAMTVRDVLDINGLGYQYASGAGGV